MQKGSCSGPPGTILHPKHASECICFVGGGDHISE